MSIFRSMAIGVGMAVLGVSSAHASLITETWQSTVTSITGANAFAVGDTFNWTVTYDNTSQRAHRYNDGPNGVAEGGLGDDTLNSTFCTTAANPVGCDSISSSITMISDAVFDLSSFYDKQAAAGYTGNDIDTTNESFRFDASNGGGWQKIADGFGFFLDNAVTAYGVTAPDGSYSRTVTDFSSKLLSTKPATVPEPSSIALMGLGLVGFGFARRRRT